MTQISNTMSDPIYDAVIASEEREVPPLAGEQTTKEGRSYTAKPWTLIWWRFRKHKLAMASLFFLIFCFFSALFADFISPYRPADIDKLNTFVPPASIHLFHDGKFQGPFIYALKRSRDPETARAAVPLRGDINTPVRNRRGAIVRPGVPG